MKKLLFCCTRKQKSASPIFETLSTADARINSPITMAAAATTDQGEWYTAFSGETQYTLPVRYQDLAPLGLGAFGAVTRATDTVTGKKVAIKKMLKPFQSPTHAKRTYRELKLLIDLNHPDAEVVQLHNVFTPEQNLADFQTVYFVFNFVDYDLNQVIKRVIPFPEEFIKEIIYSLLRSLKYIHSAGILHRDLKPTNIGMDEASNVVILDFGLARVASNGIQTGYVATRWWRAPEVFINWEHYNDKIDVWSIGCIMAELILLRPIFRGNGHIDQLNRIFEVIGTPDLTALDDISTPVTRTYLNTLAVTPRQDFNQLFGYRYEPPSETPISGVSPQGVDLLERLLTFDHRVRPTAEEALAHPFFALLHDIETEPVMEHPVVDVHQDAEYTVAQWKSIIWRMIQQFQPPAWINDDDDDK